MRRLVLVAVVTCLAACGGSSSTAPTAPTIAQVGGVWEGRETITSVSTTECAGQALAAAGVVGSSAAGSLQITQTGSALTAVETGTSSGGTTNYTGTAGASSIVLNFTTCNLCAIANLRCLSGVLRDVVPQADSINATVTGNSMSGTEATTYNVFVAGTSVNAGVLTVNGSFAATKQ